MVTAAVLAGALVIGSVAFFLGRGHPAAAGRADTSAPATTAAVVVPPSEVATASSSRVMALSRAPVTPVPLADAVDSGPARIETATTLAAKSDVPRAQSHYATRPTRPSPHDRDPSSDNASDDESSASAPAAVSPSSGTGYLTLDTFPWTHVSLSGRPLGDTPLVHVPIPSGTHTLSLDNTDENVHKSTVVTLKTGESVSRRLAF